MTWAQTIAAERAAVRSEAESKPDDVMGVGLDHLPDGLDTVPEARPTEPRRDVGRPVSAGDPLGPTGANVSRAALPASREMERAVLGGLLLAPDRLPDVLAEGVEAADFAAPEHAAVWALLLELDAEGAPIDLVTLPERVAHSADPARYGGVPYVVELADALPGAANLAYYARRVRRLGLQRRAICACWDLEDAVRAAGNGELPMLIGHVVDLLAGGAADVERELVRYLLTAPLDQDALRRVWLAVADARGWRQSRAAK
jgi:hypothetical protein